MHELIDFLHRATDLVTREQLTELQLRSIRHLVGGGMCRGSFDINLPDKIIRGGYEMQENIAFRVALGLDTKIAKPAGIVKRQNAVTDAVAIKRLPCFLRN